MIEPALSQAFRTAPGDIRSGDSDQAGEFAIFCGGKRRIRKLADRAEAGNSMWD